METIYSTAGLRRGGLEQVAHKSLVLPGTPERQTVALSDVIYIEGIGNYATFHLSDETKIVVAYLLASYQSLPGFLRIHRSYLINRSHIARVRSKCRLDAWVYLTNGVQLPIARRRVSQVVADLKDQ